MPTDLAADPAAIADELGRALQTVGALARQLQRAAREIAAEATPRLVRVKAVTPAAATGRRGPGRPRGSRNRNFLTILATEGQIAALKAQLARHPAAPGR